MLGWFCKHLGVYLIFWRTWSSTEAKSPHTVRWLSMLLKCWQNQQRFLNRQNSKHTLAGDLWHFKFRSIISSALPAMAPFASESEWDSGRLDNPDAEVPLCYSSLSVGFV